MLRPSREPIKQPKAESCQHVNDPEERRASNIDQKSQIRRLYCDDVPSNLKNHESGPKEDPLEMGLQPIKSSYQVPRSHDTMKALIELHNISTDFCAVLTACFPSTDRTIIESVVNALLITLKNSAENDTLLRLKQELPSSIEGMTTWLQGGLAV